MAFFFFPWKSRCSNEGEKCEESSEDTKAEANAKNDNVNNNDTGDEEASDNKVDKQSNNGIEDSSANKTEMTGTADDQAEVSDDDDEDIDGDKDHSEGKQANVDIGKQGSKSHEIKSMDVDTPKSNSTEKDFNGNKQVNGSESEAEDGDDNEEGDGKDKDKDKDYGAEDGSSSSNSMRSKVAPPANPRRSRVAPDEKALLAFDETVALLTGRTLREGKVVNFEEVISQTEKKINARLPECFKDQLRSRMDQLKHRHIGSTWGFTETIELETDTVRWLKKEREGITYQFGFPERGHEGFATAASSHEARELAKMEATQVVEKFVEEQLNLILRLSEKKPADLSKKKSEGKAWWPMGVLPEPTELGHTSMMLFSGDVYTGYGEGGFEENCKEAPHHVGEVSISQRGMPQTNCLSVHCWAKAFTKSLNDPEAGGAKTFLAQHAMKLANTRSVYRCLYFFRKEEDDETFLELNCYTSQYLAAVQVLGDLSSVDTCELAGKRQNQALGLRDSVPPDCQPHRVLNYAVYQPMEALGQSEEEILPAILPTDEARKAYDFSEPPPKPPILRENTKEGVQARRTFEAMQHQNRNHNKRRRIRHLCAVGKGRDQQQLWRAFLETRRAGKLLCWCYGFYYPEKNGKALMDVIYADMKLNPTKNSDELSALAYNSQKRKYIREIRKNNPQQKKPTVSNQQKRKQVQMGPPKKAKKARTVKRSEEKSMDKALWQPPVKSGNGGYTPGGSQWVRSAREYFFLLQSIAGDVGLSLNGAERGVHVGYSQMEVRQEIFSGTTLVDRVLTNFDTIEEGALEKLFHSDCRKLICALGLVDPEEFKDNGEACKTQQFKDSLCTWMQPSQVQELSWQSALVAKFFRADLELMLRRNNYCRKAKDIIRRVKVAIK